MTSNLKSVYQFLDQLKRNNSRDWFANNKSQYESSHKQVIDFADALLTEMKKQDDIETVSGKKSLHRIYRDVRFSKNKLPYKTNWSGSFRRATNALRGGYYFHLEPGNSFIAGGFWGPNPADLKHIRKHIDQDDKEVRAIIDSVETKSFFGNLVGEQVKTAPKGFAVDHPAIDLLRYKQFIFMHSYTDREVFKKDFHITMSDGFQKLRPFFNVMTEILTTDLNGISLI
jgi:uncharacterized protein (TIGR02453 family)